MTIPLFYYEKSTFSFVLFHNFVDYFQLELHFHHFKFRHYLHGVMGRNHHVVSDRDYIFVTLERGIHLFIRCNQDHPFLVSLKTDQQPRHGPSKNRLIA